MSAEEEQNKEKLKVEEITVQKDEEEQEEEEEEEKEQNEEEEQNDEKEPENKNDKNKDEGEKEIIIQKEEKGEEEEEEGVEENEVVGGNDPKKSKIELMLPNQMKINAEWFTDENDDINLEFKTPSKQKLVLHWGVSLADNQDKWNHIDKQNYPPLTNEFDAFALQTEFSNLEDGDLEQKIQIKFPRNNIIRINFVFFEKEANRWYNNDNKDYHINFD